MAALALTDAIRGSGPITQNLNSLFLEIENYLNGVTASADITITGVFTCAGIVSSGVIDGSDAASGKLGEALRSAIALANAVSLTTATYADVTSITLTAGDWDISGMVSFGGGPITGTGTRAGFGTSAGNSSTGLVLGDNEAISTLIPSATEDPTLVIPTWRKNVTSNTTIYLKAFATFTVGAPTAYGRISARRVR